MNNFPDTTPKEYKDYTELKNGEIIKPDDLAFDYITGEWDWENCGNFADASGERYKSGVHFKTFRKNYIPSVGKTRQYVHGM